MIFALLANRCATVFAEAIMNNTEHIKVLKIFLEVTVCALLGLQNYNLLRTKKEHSKTCLTYSTSQVYTPHLNILHFAGTIGTKTCTL